MFSTLRQCVVHQTQKSSSTFAICKGKDYAYAFGMFKSQGMQGLAMEQKSQ